MSGYRCDQCNELVEDGELATCEGCGDTVCADCLASNDLCSECRWGAM